MIVAVGRVLALLRACKGVMCHEHENWEIVEETELWR